MPTRLFDALNLNDKINLAPYRVPHFVVVFAVTRFVARDALALGSPISIPLIKCGGQSLAVFCVGVFLSFVGHFTLTLSSGSVAAQILTSVSGIAVITFVACRISCSRQQDAWKALVMAE
jgi:hypothetical protein